MTEFEGKAKDFTKLLAEGTSLVVYGAEWCGPCRTLNPVLEKLSKVLPAVRFVHVDVDRYEDLAEGIESIPHIRVYRDGEELDRPIQLVLRHQAASARRLLESGAMETEGEVSLDGPTYAVRGARRVSWRTGRVDIDLVSDGFRFIGGLHNLLWKGEPHRFRIETLGGAPIGDAILRPRRAPESELRTEESAAP